MSKKHPYNEWSHTARALDLLGDKWTLLIIRILIGGPVRFVEIQRRLPGISTEQLRTRLREMTENGLVERRRYREVPPRVDYELTGAGHEAVPIIGELSRWGQRFLDGPRRTEERVSIEARLLDAISVRRSPGLQLNPVVIEVDHGGGIRQFRVSASQGTVFFENVVVTPDSYTALIRGTVDQWVELFENGEVEGMEVFRADAETLVNIFFATKRVRRVA